MRNEAFNRATPVGWARCGTKKTRDSNVRRLLGSQIGGALTLEDVKRVLIIGRGASGKSTLALCLGELTGLPVIELDKIFWKTGLAPTPREQWIVIQQKLVAADRWIIDGDLGPYDVIEVRLRAADTIIFLDFSLVRCAWRAMRRSHERYDFWSWLLAYRYRSRPLLRAAIAKYAANAELHVFHNPRSLQRFVASIATQFSRRLEHRT